jgi:hypothetical protein
VGAFDKFPLPVIMAIENAPVAIGSATVSFDAVMNAWNVDYSFADGNDHLHTIISATGY